ncbi:UDP-glucose/GDP-mannose dehydrogenase family protein [Salinisphaera sp. Q1T1-3]|uniref:UDP-glucose dehydrogenase family protein n=1 Tax=Salinisphaera sp. Q1T1-3 TaxID=2321229 RepID=UPI000E767F51|nr:UDP-glucose/GDP-mannose dehydrogenase family protein [Salinisphaera sp. Q1T1-3]RJS94741.1 UDP-glucose/GDP-mannose dehydrogenase family protein [Salinisphaera sp. Q1T1-3]
MRITIFGTGYVGLVTGACLAHSGNHVVCVDVDAAKIERLRQGDIPIYEPGLETLVEENVAAGRLAFTTDAAEGVAHGTLQFIAVGTPPDEDGSADLKYVLKVAETIGEHMSEYRLVITKSTVPVGTSDRVREALAGTLAARQADLPFDVASNPEFLKEGAAIDDFMKPDRVVVGVDNERAADHLRALYAPFNRQHDRTMVMDIRSAELTKYAANIMLATKISLMNELSQVADRLDADIEQVRKAIGADHRIGYHFIYPGCGFGGSCFPKDVRALAHTAAKIGYETEIINAVERVNDRQKTVLFDKLSRHFDGDLAGRTVALWGLAFKPNTDDMREAPSLTLMEALWAAGARVRAYDPEAMNETRRIVGDRDDLVFCDDAEQAATGADALVLVTEWHIFRTPDFGALARIMAQPVLVDGRNIYKPSYVAAAGFSYYGIGRSAAAGATSHS